MKVSAFARAAGVGVETVRYYQRLGLLVIPSRPGRGPRLYSEAMAGRMGFIRRAQALGFTLEEIRNLLALSERDCASGKSIVEDKLGQLDARAAALDRMRKELREHLVRCKRARRGAPCPFLRMLSESESPRDP